MAEYIDKEYVTKCLMESWAHCGIPSDAKNKMLKWLNKAPTAADVQPVRRGRWMYLYDENYRCSECGEDFALIDGTGFLGLLNYCPNCGTRMDGAK